MKKKVKIGLSELSRVGSVIFCEVEGLEDMGRVTVCTIKTEAIFPKTFSQEASVNWENVRSIDAKCKEVNGFGLTDRILTVCNRITRLNPTLIELLQETGTGEISFTVEMEKA